MSQKSHKEVDITSQNWWSIYSTINWPLQKDTHNVSITLYNGITPNLVKIIGQRIFDYMSLCGRLFVISFMINPTCTNPLT